MFCNEEKMREAVCENGGFVKRLLGGKTRVQAHILLEEEYERTLRNYCRVLQVEGMSKLRKNGLIEAIIDFADAQGFLAGGDKAITVTEDNKPALFWDISAIEADIQDKMTAIHTHYKYLEYVSYVARLGERGEELNANALTSDIRALPATIENSEDESLSWTKLQPIYGVEFYVDMISEINNKARVARCKTRDQLEMLLRNSVGDIGQRLAVRMLCRQAGLCGGDMLSYERYAQMFLDYMFPAPEVKDDVIDVEAYEVKKYPVEFCCEVVRKPFGRKEFRHTRQIKMFPRSFMLDESNLIRNTKSEGKRG